MKTLNKKLQEVRAIIHTIKKTNRFYQKKLRAGGIVSERQITSWKTFTLIPFTDRNELEKDQATHPPFGTNLTRPISEYTYVISSSGTTTGKPFIQPFTNAEYKHYVDVWIAGDRMLGITKNDTFCHLTTVYNYPFSLDAVRQIGARMIPSEPHKTIEILKNLRRMKVTILQAYPTVLLELIELAKEQNIDLQTIGIRKIITAGESGGEIGATRDFIEHAWNSTIIDHLGSTESPIFAVECPKTHNYHTLDNYFIFEVVDPITSKPAETGELVLTILWRRDFPLIRYRTGDIVTIRYERCPCGHKGPYLIGGVHGRTNSLVKIRAGFIYPNYIEKILRDIPGIITYDIALYKNMGMDTMRIFFEFDPNTSFSNIHILNKRLFDHLGFTPDLYPLLPKTLPRVGFRKSNKFHDYRPDMVPPSKSRWKLFSKMYFVSHRLRHRGQKLRQIYSILTGADKQR